MTSLNLWMLSLAIALLGAGLVAHLAAKACWQIYVAKDAASPIWDKFDRWLCIARDNFLRLGAVLFATFAVFWLAGHVFNALRQHV